MYACHDCGAAILSAARRARHLAIDLVVTQGDPRLIVPFFETAIAIDEVGQALGIRELVELSVDLVFAAKQELSSRDDLTPLDSVVSRLSAIAAKIGQDTGSSQSNRPDFNRDSMRTEFIPHLTGSR